MYNISTEYDSNNFYASVEEFIRLIRDDIGVNNHDHTMCNWEIFSYKFDSTKFKAEYKV